MTNIEWTDKTWNPVTGCTRASAGCDNCYAVTMTKRLEAMGQEKYAGLVNPGKNHFNGVVKCHEDALEIPLKWRKPRTIFVNSMSDLFHRDVTFEFIDKVWAVMEMCPQHTFQCLTKRPERMAEYMERYRADVGNGKWPLPNVWLGTSVENQAAADERIPHLLRCPAAVRFLSVEPMLGGIDLTWIAEPDDDKDGVIDALRGKNWIMTDMAKCEVTKSYRNGYESKYLRRQYIGCGYGAISWVICGGESGANARPFEINWARDLRDQCAAAGVPFFMKQDSGHHPGQQGRIPDDLWIKEFPNVKRQSKSIGAQASLFGAQEN